MDGEMIGRRDMVRDALDASVVSLDVRKDDAGVVVRCVPTPSRMSLR